jgi:hypothetical protein
MKPVTFQRLVFGPVTVRMAFDTGRNITVETAFGATEYTPAEALRLSRVLAQFAVHAKKRKKT